MDIAEAVVSLGKRVRDHEALIETEEATKNAFIMPFISQVLGYDVFNPLEVVPEFVADVGIKKGEKIDYAIMQGGAVQILVECKKIRTDLTLENASQLFRYFTVSKAKIALLTNGRIYEFYSDLDESNVMDAKPFLRIDITDVPTRSIAHLKKLGKESFDLDGVLSTARRLKYIVEMKQVLGNELRNPSEEFVRLITRRVYRRPVTTKITEEFTGFLAEAANQLLDDEASTRLKKALQDDSAADAPARQAEEPSNPEPTRAMPETTPEELEAFGMVKSYCLSVVAGSRLAYRDGLHYMSVLVDDNNRKPVVRLYLNNPKQRRVGVFAPDGAGGRTETLHDLTTIDDLQQFADDIRQAAQMYA
ncbi:MAG: type I restriction enzyme HsdR N-terminal domain-containing protein [Propionibacteriaceae bacterium]|jgi:hypothetical protein|nr:type I restriction enzyme HsdR N-terminal domain-containing protein [Propionibacteriaceae bacterium]